MRGTITKYKKDGIVKSWGFYFRKRDASEDWEQVTKGGFPTKREAEQALRDALTAAGLVSERQPAALETIPTFQELFEHFLTEAGMDCTAGTLENYRKHSRYSVRTFGLRRINTITTEELQEFFNHLRLVGGDKGKPLSPKTLKHVRFILKSVFDAAIKAKHLAGTPLTKDVKTPKLRKKRFKMPEKQHLKETIEKARGRRLHPILAVTAGTGLRMGELLALQWPDYDEEAGILEISKALEETKRAIRVKGTKSDETRLVSLPASAIEALREQRDFQERDKRVLGKSYDDQGYIFCPPQGGFYRPSKVSSRVSAFLRKHRLALSMHGLRHAHASHLLSRGADVQSVADRLGHADPSITLSIYSHVIPSDRGRLALLWDDDRKLQVVEMLGRASLKREKPA
jgi:integrase